MNRPQSEPNTPGDHRRESRIFHSLDMDGTGSVSRTVLAKMLASSGLRREDGRLAQVFAALEPLDGPPLDLDVFADVVSTAGILVERAVRGSLVIPDFAEFESCISNLYDTVAANRSGKQADYIPPLADVDPEGFGVSLVMAALPFQGVAARA